MEVTGTKTDYEAALDEAERKLNEALSGHSGKSKNSLIKEALKAIRQAK